jgi:spermidine/putrescine transport system permease protein
MPVAVTSRIVSYNLCQMLLSKGYSLENRSRPAVLVFPAALFLAVLFLLPLGIMALFTFRAGTFGPASQQFTLAHYQNFLTNTAFQNLLWRSVILSFWVSLYTVVLAYPVAYFLAYHAGSSRLFLLTIIIVPAWVSYLLRVLSWKVILGGSGVLASFLEWIGVTPSGPILIYSPDAVIVTLVYVWIPFVALPIFVALERIDRTLLEAAVDLGCSRWEAFLRVTLPLSLPGVVAGFLFVFIPTVGEYVTPALVGGPQGIMFGNIIFDQFLRGLNWPLGALMSLAMLVVILIPLLLIARFGRLSELTGL